jgi:hypothetical protein
MMERRIELTPDEAKILCRPVNGDGGFQSLLRGLQQKLDTKTGVLMVSDVQFERIIRYTSQYGWGGFEGRLEAIRRTFPESFD